MKLYELNKTRVINDSIDNVLIFFQNPRTSKQLPEKLSFKILTPTPIVMDKGTVIDYTKRLFGIQSIGEHSLQSIIRLMNLLMNKLKVHITFGIILTNLKRLMVV
ncbi:MAG: hypothetical protein Ct9H300mP18_10020 [Candidatus Neomarinimicrobiota bacterium]|nr:MAG: hypothetical protein Ct9H300mP18_10020 [Candidatus Neomarinimicrobiota bacterium]